MTRLRGDRGAVLILTLILTVVLAVVVGALAAFVSVGLKTSETTDIRSETNADGAAAITWWMDGFRDGSRDYQGAGVCDGTTQHITPPTITVNGSAVTVTCTVTAPSGSFPVVFLQAEAIKDGTLRRVEAVAQLAPGIAVRALDWKVDDSKLAGP